MRSVFVTGAYGMIGSGLVAALLDRGDHVTVLKRGGGRPSGLVIDGLESRCAVVEGDVTTPGLAARVIAEYACDVVFHLAAQSLVGAAERAPIPTFDVNIRGTWLLLEAAREAGSCRVVLAGSSKAYGPSSQPLLSEEDPLEPTSPYDVAKACEDLIGRWYWQPHGVPVAVTRLGNTYGPRDLQTSRLVPGAVRAALAGEAPVIRSDGSPRREFLYVDDAVRAYLLIADALETDDPRRTARGEAFNGTGPRRHSVREVVEQICRLASSDTVPVVLGEGAGPDDPPPLSSEKLGQRTGWAPRVDLEEGLRRTVAWYRDHPETLGLVPATSTP